MGCLDKLVGKLVSTTEGVITQRQGCKKEITDEIDP
jgi:hypothetical protein